MPCHRYPRWAAAGCWASGLALLVAGGCSRGDHTVIHGTVTLDGRPLESGGILFTPIDRTQGTATGSDVKQGHYQSSPGKPPAIGRNRVEITAQRPTGRMAAD